jgi:hypothetical protein
MGGVSGEAALCSSIPNPQLETSQLSKKSSSLPHPKCCLMSNQQVLKMVDF